MTNTYSLQLLSKEDSQFESLVTHAENGIVLDKVENTVLTQFALGASLCFFAELNKPNLAISMA